jgi:hypothetical protein
MCCLKAEIGDPNIIKALSTKKIKYITDKSLLEGDAELSFVLFEKTKTIKIKLSEIPKNNTILKCSSIGFTSKMKMDEQKIQLFVEEVCLAILLEQKKAILENLKGSKKEKKEEKKEEEENKEIELEEIESSEKTNLDNFDSYVYAFFDGRISNGKTKIFKKHQEYVKDDIISLKYDQNSQRIVFFHNENEIDTLFVNCDLESENKCFPFLLLPKGLKLIVFENN